MSPTASSISVLSKVGATGTFRIYLLYRNTRSPKTCACAYTGGLNDQSRLRHAVWSTGSTLLSFVPGPFWGRKRRMWAGTPLGQRSPEGVSSAAKSVRNLLVSRVSERTPWSKTRGEAAWGGHLAGTAENSGPDPKPIKINGKAPTSCRNTWHRAPPDTAHLWLSPGSCTYRRSVCPHRRGHESSWLVSLGLPPGQLVPPVPACRDLGSFSRLPLQHRPFIPPPWPATSPPFQLAAAREGLVLLSARSRQGGQRGHPSAHACVCKPVSLWQVAKYFAG